MFQSAAPTPFNCQPPPPPTPTFHSATSWVGVSPVPHDMPAWPLKVSLSLARQVASQLTNCESALESGREIWSYTPYWVPATGAKSALMSVLLRTT